MLVLFLYDWSEAGDFRNINHFILDSYFISVKLSLISDKLSLPIRLNEPMQVSKSFLTNAFNLRLWELHLPAFLSSYCIWWQQSFSNKEPRNKVVKIAFSRGAPLGATGSYWELFARTILFVLLSSDKAELISLEQLCRDFAIFEFFGSSAIVFTLPDWGELQKIVTLNKIIKHVAKFHKPISRRLMWWNLIFTKSRKVVFRFNDLL